jgi:DNA-binding transcriptional LysR family regulator
VRLGQQEILELARRPLFIEDLYEDPLVLAAVPGVPGFDDFQADKAVQPKTLTRLPLVLPEPDARLRRDFDRRCRDAGIQDRLRVAVEVGPWATAMNFVRDGVGVGVVPRSATLGQTGLVVKPLPARLVPSNTVRVISRKRAGTDDLDLTEGAVAFLEALREAARGMGSET